jgi:hypothetical protein
MTLLLALYPTYALIKNELLQGSNHVSLEWAVRWQLFKREGSGSIFDPHSTAHAVTSSWLAVDPWLPKIALALLLPGLVFRRTRAVALAFAIQVFELLRNGYLPYPFVVAMIPFAALTVAGVLDSAWQSARVRLPDRIAAARVVAWLHADRPTRRSPLGAGWLERRRSQRPGELAGAIGVFVRLAVVAAVLAGTAVVSGPWRYGLHDLWHNDRDAGPAAALAWVRTNVDPAQRVVVDDAFWVDLVRHGYDRHRVIWFTKLDVDPGVRLPSTPQWKSIDYVVLDHHDQLSVHLSSDGTPSPVTVRQFATLGGALQHARIVATFGTGLDEVTVWRVEPHAPPDRVPK